MKVVELSRYSAVLHAVKYRCNEFRLNEKETSEAVETAKKSFLRGASAAMAISEGIDVATTTHLINIYTH